MYAFSGALGGNLGLFDPLTQTTLLDPVVTLPLSDVSLLFESGLLTHSRQVTQSKGLIFVMYPTLHSTSIGYAKWV